MFRQWRRWPEASGQRVTTLPRQYGTPTWVRQPSDAPGLLPFWLWVLPEAYPRDGRLPLVVGPQDLEDMERLSVEDVERTTDWFVRVLAVFLDRSA